MIYRIEPLPGESEFIFASRRLRITAIAAAYVAAFGVVWWLTFPQILIFDHGSFAFFLSVLVSFAILILGISLAVLTPMFLLIFLWHLLERRYPQIRSPRKVVESGIEAVLLILVFGYTSYELYTAATVGVVDKIARFGLLRREVAISDNPLFFWIYLSIYAVCWAAFAIWLGFKARKYSAR